METGMEMEMEMAAPYLHLQQCPHSSKCLIQSTIETVILAQTKQFVLTKELPQFEVEAVLLGACPYVPAVFNSTVTCNNTKSAVIMMQALPGARIAASIADPVVDVRQARVTLRVMLENTISYLRSGEVSCDVTNSDALSFRNESASLETVWMDADKHALSDTMSKPLCYFKKEKALYCHAGDTIGHNIKTLVLPFNIVSKTPPPPHNNGQHRLFCGLRR